MFDIIKFGGYISRLRKKSDLTQSELAEKIGITRQAISKYENGDSFPDISVLVMIAETFGTTIDNLINAGEATETEAALLKSPSVDTEFPKTILDCGTIKDIVNIAPYLKPSLLDRIAKGFSKHGIDIANIVELAEYMNDESVVTLLEKATFETLDTDLLKRFMPFLDEKSKYTIFEKIIEGELDYRLLRIIMPYIDYLRSQVEAAVIYGALDEKALDILHEL